MDPDDEDDEESCKKRKCKKTKNPCKICLQPCKPKNAMQCEGACGSWVHFSCANLTKGKIRDIKDGVIDITCPCPDCKSSLPKEVLRDSLYTCNNVRCPANNPPSCDSDTCQANKAAAMLPKRCPPPGTLRKCGRNVCRVFSNGHFIYSYDEDCTNKCEYKRSDANCYHNESKSSLFKTYFHKDDKSDSGSIYSCEPNPQDPCCVEDIKYRQKQKRAEKSKRAKMKRKYCDRGQDSNEPWENNNGAWESEMRCRKPHDDEDDDCDQDNISVCYKPKSSKHRHKKKKMKKQSKICCCSYPEPEEEDCDPQQNDQENQQQRMAEEMMEMCKTVVDLEHRIESILGKLVCSQTPTRSNKKWQVRYASVHLTNFLTKNPHQNLYDTDKEELRCILRTKYEELYKKLFIIISVIIAIINKIVET